MRQVKDHRAYAIGIMWGIRNWVKKEIAKPTIPAIIMYLEFSITPETDIPIDTIMISTIGIILKKEPTLKVKNSLAKWFIRIMIIGVDMQSTPQTPHVNFNNLSMCVNTFSFLVIALFHI